MNLEMFDFYKKLEPQAKDFLKMRLHPVEAPKDTLLYAQGDICDSVIFLTQGEFKVVQEIDETDEKLLYTLQAPKQCIVNLSSTLSQTPAIATAVSTTEIKGYILDMYSLKDLCKQSDAYLSYIFSLFNLENLDPLIHNQA